MLILPGLAVEPCPPPCGVQAERNGWVFEGLDERSMAAALHRAFALFRSQPQQWHAVSCRNMQVPLQKGGWAEGFHGV